MKYMLITLFFCSSAFATQKVAVIDTGIDPTDPRFSSLLCKDGVRDYTGEGIYDTVGHGTHVAGSIVENAGKADFCLIILKYYSEKQGDLRNTINMFHALEEAKFQKADVINISGGGESFNEEEYNLIKFNNKATYVTAAGNHGANIDYGTNKFYPASYELPNVLVIGSLTKSGKRAKSSNFGSRVTHWEVGEDVFSTVPCNLVSKNGCRMFLSGTSMATAVATGKLVKLRSRK